MSVSQEKMEEQLNYQLQSFGLPDIDGICCQFMEYVSEKQIDLSQHRCDQEKYAAIPELSYLWEYVSANVISGQADFINEYDQPVFKAQFLAFFEGQIGLDQEKTDFESR